MSVQSALPVLSDEDLATVSRRAQELHWAAHDNLDRLESVHARMDAFVRGVE